MKPEWKVTSLLFPFSLLCSLLFAQAPQLEWAVRMGSNGFDEGQAIVVDDDGNIYTTGYFQGVTDFDPGPDTWALTSNGFTDAYIQKLDKHGNLLWAISFGGTDNDRGLALALGPGYLIATGFFFETVDFDPGPGTYNLSSEGAGDIFILKLDDAGHLIWAKGMGGSQGDAAYCLAIDDEENVFLTGSFAGTTDLDPGPGTCSFTSLGGMDIFILKLDSEGNYLHAGAMGSAGVDELGASMALDAGGNILLTGYYNGTADFDPGPGVFLLDHHGEEDIFIVKLNPNCSLLWARGIGGTLWDECYHLALNSDEQVLLTGYFSGKVDFDPGLGFFELGQAGAPYQLFLLRLDGAGNFDGAFALGDENSTLLTTGLAVDKAGNTFIQGIFQGTVDFDPGPGASFLSEPTDFHLFTLKVNALGEFDWANSIPASGEVVGRAMTVDQEGNICFTGRFDETADFDPGASSYELFSAGVTDIFVAKWWQGPDATHHLVFPSPITLYPNPATDRFTIDMSAPYADVTVEITTLTGQVMQRWQGDIYHPLELEISGPAGLYLAQVRDKEGRQAVLKIIKL